MRTLTVMRHAKSSWEDPGQDDRDRPLNARGEKTAKLMAKRLKADGYRPDLVIVSSARRTQQTAEALQAVFGGALTLQTEPRLYEAGSEVYADVVRGVGDGVVHLMLIGHNPTAEWMAETLCGEYRRMPTGAYFRVEIPQAWQAFRLQTFNLIAYDYPKSDK
jgi:phosphohistidine phosphatase